MVSGITDDTIIHPPTRTHCSKCTQKTHLQRGYCAECRFLLRFPGAPKLTKFGLETLGLGVPYIEKQRAEAVPCVLRVEQWPEIDTDKTAKRSNNGVLSKLFPSRN